MSHDDIQHLTDETFEAAIQKGITLVDFHAEWCGPCRMLAPVLQEVAKEVQGKAKIAKVDIDQAQRIAADYEVSSVPTMILFKDGKQVGQLVGLRNAATIKQFIDSAK